MANFRTRVWMTMIGMAMLASVPVFVVAGIGGGMAVALGGTALAVTIAALAASFLASSIGRPLDQLSGHIGQVAKGNLNVTLPPSDGDDVDNVFSAFASMVANLRKSIAEMSRKRSHPPPFFYAAAGIAGSGGSSRPLRAARMTVPR